MSLTFAGTVIFQRLIDTDQSLLAYKKECLVLCEAEKLHRFIFALSFSNFSLFK